MELLKITIENFKSIDKLEFDIKKYGSSHTSMFVGINETGKSNILQAMSFLELPKEPFEFKELNNRNNTKSESIDLYFEMKFKNKKTYLEILKEKLIESKKFFEEFLISKIIKNVFLEKNKKNFECQYELEFDDFDATNYFNKKNPASKIEIKHKSELKEADKELYEKLDTEKLEELLKPILEEIIIKYEPSVTFWKSEKEFLISKPIDLNSFKNNPSINIPLKNLFALSDYKTNEEIKTKVEDIVGNHDLRRGLSSQLTNNATNYFTKVWDQNIVIDVEISESLLCTVHVKDKGKLNENKFFNMNSRSQGFHQFASLILSLSIQTHILNMKNQLILIDEPENHLHPSGIRNMMQELLNIGQNNYVFLATHSCFMIDHKNKERNFIIKKDKKQNTVFNQITEELNIYDDEVLCDAFGINVYKDFLSPYKVLVEGLSDKKILQKTIAKLKIIQDIRTTNGYGSNIVSIASRFNFEKIKPLVLLDDDKTGSINKDKIIAIGGIYSNANVFTIRDIEPKIISKGTIEDTLGQRFVQSSLASYWCVVFKNKLDKFVLNESSPFIEQIKAYLKEEKPEEDKDKFLEGLKTKISEDFNPSNMDKNFSLLKNLVEKIVKKLKEDDL